jgi:hypothetical protein
MFNTTLDILYFVLSVAIGFIAIFICWFLFYLVMAVRDIRKLTKGLQEEASKFVSFMNKFCDKFEHATSYFVVLVDIAKELMQFFMKERKKGKK